MGDYKVKTFEHEVDFTDQFTIGDTIYNEAHFVRAVILSIGECTHRRGNFCPDCKSEGRMLQVRKEDGGVASWCHSLWNKDY
jgi:hypothetical protein